jgi:hypothetical protein
VITLERLDELQFGRGTPVTADELIELVKSHRSVQRQIRSLTSFRDRIDGALRDLHDLLAPVGAPEPLPIVAPVIVDEEVECL